MDTTGMVVYNTVVCKLGYWNERSCIVIHYKVDMLILFNGKHGRCWFDEQYSSWDEGMTQATRPYLTLRYTFVNTIQICDWHAPWQSDISLVSVVP